MKKAVVFLACVLCAPAADVDALLESVKSAPPEFAADAMIRLAATDKVDKARRVELLVQAFARAADAQHSFPEHAVPLRLDGSVTYWNRLFLQDLDELTLRMRAIEALLPLDAKKARELFATIAPLQLPKLKCEDFLIYDVGRFYTAMGNVARQAFTPAEVAEGGPARFLGKYAGSVGSAVELAPMAKVLASTAVNDAEFQALVGSFAHAMGKVAGDDRSFSYSTPVGKEIQNLVEEAKQRKVSPLTLIEGYRLYLVVNFSGARCADDDQMQPGQQSFGIYTGAPVDPVSANFVAFFNEKLRMAPLAPIQEQEVTPTRLEGVAEGFQYCQDDACKGFVERFRGLVFAANGTPVIPAERNTPEWQAKLKAELERLAGWKSADGAGAVLSFREKSGAYSELLNLAQNGPNRELVLRAWLDFVARNPVQKAYRLEWLLAVNALIGRVTLDPGGLSKFGEDLRKSGDPWIAMYANLESLAPRTPDKILPLL